MFFFSGIELSHISFPFILVLQILYSVAFFSLLQECRLAHNRCTCIVLFHLLWIVNFLLFLGVKMKMNIAGIVSNYFYNACNCFPSFLSIHLEMCFVLHKRGCTYSSKIPKTVQAQYLYKKCASRTSAINSRKKQRR